uniref:Lipocalin/cytosolic fatty-acid binding domain-containing protein n=1 Tax=Leptobrachium leishanense TaxID=445787 RepID=A0A8C5QYW3_9ANUR
MKGLMLALGFLVALCTLCAQAQPAIQPDFKPDKIVGKWYSFALASNSDWFQAKRGHMKMCTTVITPTADGNLEVESTYPKNDRCEKRTMTYIKTDTPGRYTSKGIRTGSELDITVTYTNYDGYCIITTRINRGQSSSVMVSLFGRTQNMQAELFDRFREVAQAQGLNAEDVLILPQTGQCIL